MIVSIAILGTYVQSVDMSHITNSLKAIHFLID